MFIKSCFLKTQASVIVIKEVETATSSKRPRENEEDSTVKKVQVIQHKIIPQEGTTNNNGFTGKGLIIGDKYSYKGEIVDNLPHGEGVLTETRGRIITGKFVEGKMDGMMIMKTPGRPEIREEYKNGKPVFAQVLSLECTEKDVFIVL